MDLSATQIIKEIGGGLAAVVIVVQFLVIWILYKSKEQLIERLLKCSENNAAKATEMHEKTLTTVANLTTATQASTSTAQAALNLLERRDK